MNCPYNFGRFRFPVGSVVAGSALGGFRFAT